MKTLKIVSIGGGGLNAVNHMIDSGLTGAQFIACSTCEFDLQMSKAANNIWLDDGIIHGLDGSTVSRSEQAAIKSRDKILSAFDGADAIIIVAGLGGFCGTGASPIVAQYARELGALTIAVVTLPYRFEGPKRSARANAAVEKLSACTDAIIKIRNDKLLQVVDKKTPLAKAFNIADEILLHAVRTLVSVFQNAFKINPVEFC